MAAVVQQDIIGFGHNSKGVLPATELGSRTHALPYCRGTIDEEPERTQCRFLACALVPGTQATICKSLTHEFHIVGAYFIQEGADVRIRQYQDEGYASEFAFIDVYECASKLHTRMYVWMLRKHQFQKLRARWLESADRVLQSPHEHNLLALSDCASQPPPQLGAFPNELFFAATIVPRRAGAVGKPHKGLSPRRVGHPPAAQQPRPRRRRATVHAVRNPRGIAKQPRGPALATGQQLAVEQQFWPVDPCVHCCPSVPVQQLNMERPPLLLPRLMPDDASIASWLDRCPSVPVQQLNMEELALLVPFLTDDASIVTPSPFASEFDLVYEYQ